VAQFVIITSSSVKSREDDSHIRLFYGTVSETDSYPVIRFLLSQTSHPNMI